MEKENCPVQENISEMFKQYFILRCLEKDVNILGEKYIW